MGKMRILIENTAGMGTAVGSRLEEVAALVSGLRELNAGACLDTAHLFAAGYDIRTAEGLDHTIDLADRTIDLDNIPVLHINDSKIPLGGRVDRHENLGKGKIGEEAFRRILQHPRLGSSSDTGLPGRVFLLETPIDEPGDDRKNVAKLWEYAGLADIAPEAEKGFSMLTTALKKIRKQMAIDAAKLTRTEQKIKAKAAASEKPQRRQTRTAAPKTKKNAVAKKRK
jgi:hypothetical protein